MPFRSSWANPLGWAGLLKIPPDDAQAIDLLAERVAELELELRELDLGIDAERSALRGLRVQANSLQHSDSAQDETARRRVTLAEREAALNQTIATRTRLAEEHRAHLSTLSRPLPVEPPRRT